MKSQSVIVLAAAILLGLLAVIGVNFFLTRPNEGPATAKADTTTVVVAAAPLFFGAKIGPEQLKEVVWPADALPPGAFTRIADVSAGEPEGRIALRPIEINEPVLASKVSGKGGRLSMSGLIAEDMRAATVRVNDVIGVGGFVLPGDRVDVLITRARPGIGDGKEMMTDVLMQNIRVVGVDTDANEAKDKPEVVKSATLEVTQEQAMKLTLAQQVGSLSLALRNLTNEAPEVPRTLLERDLRDGATASPAVVARSYSGPRRVRAAPSIEVVRGIEPQKYSVPSYGGS